jgi:hypothetical protein
MGFARESKASQLLPGCARGKLEANIARSIEGNAQIAHKAWRVEDCKRTFHFETLPGV